MSHHFHQKVCWITGASSGIGEALAYALSAENAFLILSSRRPDQLERVKAACAYPDRVRVLPLDLLDIPSLQAKTSEAIGCFGHIDIMVHNGGISQRSRAMDTDLSVHRRVMELDYFSYVELTHRLLPHFTDRGQGHFVVMSSVMGKIGTPMRSAYAAAKHALHGYFDCLRAEGIRVTVLTPGYIRTQIAFHAVKGDGSQMSRPSANIEHGLPADKGARRILRAVAQGRYEAYIGKFGGERIALWLNRLAPALLMKIAPKFAPK
jgi:dehydrogenase/reductase SDR family member 7B